MTSYQNNLMTHVKAAIEEWHSISYPTKGLAETIVSRLQYEGYSYNPARENVADTYLKAAHIAQYTADENEDHFDRDTCEFLAANFIARAKSIRKTGPAL